MFRSFRLEDIQVNGGTLIQFQHVNKLGVKGLYFLKIPMAMSTTATIGR